MPDSNFIGFPKVGEGVHSITKCPLCDADCSPNETTVLDRDVKGNLLHLSCGKCFSSILAVFSQSEGSMTSVGLFTELLSNEVNGFCRQPAISVDDVIDTHCLLDEERSFWEKIL